MPCGQYAIGWKVGIYWPDNSTFYTGLVVGFDNVSGRHHVFYDSGDQEHVSLEDVKVGSPQSVRLRKATLGATGHHCTLSVLHHIFRGRAFKILARVCQLLHEKSCLAREWFQHG